MKPFLHARGSVSRWGGKSDDYMPIHDFIDNTKIAMPDLRHRAILHNGFGCFLVERVFGHTLKNSDGREVSTRDVAEQHVIEDMGFLPSLEDWLADLPQQTWHGGLHRLSKDKREKEINRMALKTMIENLNKARENYEAQLKTMGADAQKAVADALGALIPEGKALVWTQYTPYFNDGEPCEFGVGDAFLQDVNEDNDYEAYDGESLPSGLRDAWRALPEDMMESAFGDHVMVWVKRGGAFAVNEHSHD